MYRREIANAARAAALDAIWRQWATIGAPVSATTAATSVIDLEALLLLSWLVDWMRPRI